MHQLGNLRYIEPLVFRQQQDDVLACSVAQRMKQALALAKSDADIVNSPAGCIHDLSLLVETHGRILPAEIAIGKCFFCSFSQ